MLFNNAFYGSRMAESYEMSLFGSLKYSRDIKSATVNAFGVIFEKYPSLRTENNGSGYTV